mgnify:FL=1
MDSETEKIIKEQLEIIPTEIKNLLADHSLKDKIINIGKKNELNEEQLGTLQLETYLVLVGLVHPDEYSEELKDRLKVNEMKADNIINEIDKEVLNGIREQLAELFVEEPEDDSDWKQNLDFIFPKWDDSLFQEETDTPIPETPVTNKTPTTLITSPTLADTKANTQKTNIPIKPTKMTDIKSNIK